MENRKQKEINIEKKIYELVYEKKDKFIYCPMCEEKHENNTLCQMNFNY